MWRRVWTVFGEGFVRAFGGEQEDLVVLFEETMSHY